jgi:hypothetical protein
MKTSQFVELTASDMEAIRGGLQEGRGPGRPLRRLIRFLVLLLLWVPDRAPGGPVDPPALRGVVPELRDT